MLNVIPEQILLISRDFRILWANKTIIDLLHLKENKIIGDFCYKVTHHRDEPCQPPHDICPMEKALKTGKPIHVIHTHFDKDGNELYVEVSAYPIKDKKGEIVQFVHITRDATNRVKAEKALAEAKDYTDNIIKSMIDTLIVVNPDATIRIANRETCELLSYKEDELIGKPVATIFAEEMPFKGTRMKKLIEKGSIRDYEMIYKTKKGEKIPVSFSGSVMKTKGCAKYKDQEDCPVFREKGVHTCKESRLVGIVGIARDMREIKEFINQLEDKTRELEKSSRELKEATMQLVQSEKLSALGELTASVAHELNQPLNAIKIISQSILRDVQKDRYEKENVEQDLPEIVSQVNKMAGIIDHMRIFSRRLEGMPREMIDVNVAVEGPFKFLEQQLKIHNIEVIKKLTADLPKVMGNPISLEQVFMNLIINARNVLESCGKENKRIEIRTYKIDSRQSPIKNPAVVVEVKDNASGIPEHLKEKIFEPFFTTGPSGKGTGLGLSVANKIIEEHRGKIELESKVGEGAIFRVILPIAD